MPLRHSTGRIHPMARTWHIKRRLREQGRMSHQAWRAWAEDYINAMPDTPWRTFCIREVHRITGEHIRMSIARSRRDTIEELQKVALVIHEAEKERA